MTPCHVVNDGKTQKRHVRNSQWKLDDDPKKLMSMNMKVVIMMKMITMMKIAGKNQSGPSLVKKSSASS